MKTEGTNKSGPFLGVYQLLIPTTSLASFVSFNIPEKGSRCAKRLPNIINALYKEQLKVLLVQSLFYEQAQF